MRSCCTARPRTSACSTTSAGTERTRRRSARWRGTGGWCWTLARARGCWRCSPAAPCPPRRPWPARSTAAWPGSPSAWSPPTASRTGSGWRTSSRATWRWGPASTCLSARTCASSSSSTRSCSGRASCPSSATRTRGSSPPPPRSCPAAFASARCSSSAPPCPRPTFLSSAARHGPSRSRSSASLVKVRPRPATAGSLGPPSGPSPLNGTPWRSTSEGSLLLGPTPTLQRSPSS
mmetsp:Transcript_49329/g.142960  ORF Transcript_49329/g.142960 Transcript_49329/m.142960 type:complete len:234 (+) Transcript_49329:163-864(+)